jgi:hypothetical protein
VSLEVGSGMVDASFPFGDGALATARASVALRFARRQMLELECVTFGALKFGQGDDVSIFAADGRALPNTSGMAAGISHVFGDRLAVVSAGGGLYRLAYRKGLSSEAAAGFHMGLTGRLARFSDADLVVGARALLLPQLSRSRIWVVPLTAGLRFR